MTDAPYPGPEEIVYAWMGVPDVGRESMLMVVLANQGPDGHREAFRPLITSDEDQAIGWAGIAQDAGEALGVKPVLRRYQLVRVDEGVNR